MRGNLVETLMGAFVLVVALGFMGFVYARADLGTVRGYELVAKFERIDGLVIGGDVLLGGIKVGSIVDQSLDPETYLAVVRLSIDRAIQLPDDSFAKVASNGLLGDKFLALIPGGSEEMLAPGDEIMFTQGSIDLVDLFAKAIFSQASGGEKAPAE